MNALQDGYLGILFIFFVSVFRLIFLFFNHVYKIHQFSNFQKKPDDMLCKLVSAIYIQNMKSLCLFLIPK